MIIRFRFTSCGIEVWNAGHWFRGDDRVKKNIEHLLLSIAKERKS